MNFESGCSSRCCIVFLSPFRKGRTWDIWCSSVGWREKKETFLHVFSDRQEVKVETLVSQSLRSVSSLYLAVRSESPLLPILLTLNTAQSEFNCYIIVVVTVNWIFNAKKSICIIIFISELTHEVIRAI